MSFARAIIRGRALNERFAVNGSYQASRSFGADRSLAALDVWAVMAFLGHEAWIWILRRNLAAVSTAAKGFARKCRKNPFWLNPVGSCSSDLRLSRHGGGFIACRVQGLRHIKAL